MYINAICPIYTDLYIPNTIVSNYTSVSYDIELFRMKKGVCHPADSIIDVAYGMMECNHNVTHMLMSYNGYKILQKLQNVHHKHNRWQHSR